MIKVLTIETGFFKLDGGAMFGVVPKTLWNKLNPADENNMCTWVMRCLLVEDGNRKILVDTGIGSKQSEKFFSFYDLHGTDSLIGNLAVAGVKPEEITDVVLTHLHFDHCGGAVKWNADKTGYEPAFPNATYWSTERHWHHATNPNAREKPSFLKENFEPLMQAGVVKFLPEHELQLTDAFSLLSVDGHTHGMILPVIQTAGGTLAYCADLIPSSYHIPVNYVMGYDIEPLKSMDDKARFLNRALEENWTLFFEHDPRVECCTVKINERGAYAVDRVFRLGEH